MKELLVGILFIKTCLFLALTFATYQPHSVGSWGLVGIVGGLGLTANFPYTISRVWVYAFSKNTQRYSWWSKLALMMVVGIIFGYFIGFCSWSRLNVALMITTFFSALIASNFGK